MTYLHCGQYFDPGVNWPICFAHCDPVVSFCSIAANVLPFNLLFVEDFFYTETVCPFVDRRIMIMFGGIRSKSSKIVYTLKSQE